MAVGDRIKRVRNFRGMTQKELGIAVGFDEKSAGCKLSFSVRADFVRRRGHYVHSF